MQKILKMCVTASQSTQYEQAVRTDKPLYNRSNNTVSKLRLYTLRLLNVLTR